MTPAPSTTPEVAAAAAPESAPPAPRVFISYSHDSPEHKQWVGKLAVRLRDNGVDVILDQWELEYGDDLPKFMERSVREADRVLMICTETYVKKADEGTGGVGYEAMVVTGELVRQLETRKFIPVMRSGDRKPTSVSTRFHADLRDRPGYEEQFEELLKRLHKVVSLPKPPLGPNPFAGGATVLPAADTKTSAEVVAQAVNVVADPAQLYREALEIARRNDVVAWRRLMNQVRPTLAAPLQVWREKVEREGLPSEEAELCAFTKSGVDVFMPLIAMALAGVESTNSRFSNQTGVLDDILSRKDWNRNGYVIVINMPEAAAFVYQAWHGALCLETDQLGLAVQLARSRVEQPSRGESQPVYQSHNLFGWPEALAHNCSTAWRFLTGSVQRWPWLTEPFGSEENFQAALTAYYAAIHVAELADRLAAGKSPTAEPEALDIDVPPMFAIAAEGARTRAYRMLTKDREAARQIWQEVGVTREQMLAAWPDWNKCAMRWIGRSHRWGRHYGLLHEKILEDVR